MNTVKLKIDSKRTSQGQTNTNEAYIWFVPAERPTRHSHQQLGFLRTNEQSTSSKPTFYACKASALQSSNLDITETWKDNPPVTEILHKWQIKISVVWV